MWDIEYIGADSLSGDALLREDAAAMQAEAAVTNTSEGEMGDPTGLTPDDGQLDAVGREAAANARKGDPAQDVLRWLQLVHYGTLSTLSTEEGLEGFPTGSIVPFALDERGRPFILIADIAAHTKNLRADPRASLFLHDPEASGDPQKSWRACLTGRFTRNRNEEAHEGLMARYLARVPGARNYAAHTTGHGFHFWVLEILSVRYIAGFGRILSFPGAELRDAAQSHFGTWRQWLWSFWDEIKMW